MKTVVACYCIAVGVLLVVWWVKNLQGAWNRGDRPHSELGLHLAAEFVTAALLIAAGSTWLVSGSAARALLAASLGMLLYTVILSPGYFLARGEWPVVGMFAALVALTVAALIVVLT